MTNPIENVMAQKLAANEPWARSKAVKKIKKWFSVKANFEEEEMMKIWKGLYYCFWMSDKPLVQEELAETISSFVNHFKNKETSFLYIKCFLKTFLREWFGIDRWRTDKFMLFTRRFLKHIFKFAASHNWERNLVENVSNTLKTELILSPVLHTSLGFQLHFTDVFLEELAKVGGEELDHQVLEIFLAPYIEVVKDGRDERFKDHVVERIFNHLLRQSDPGIHWEMEEDGEEIVDQEDVDDEDMEEVEDIDDEDMKEVEEEEDESENGEQYPRAGKGDAYIPQLKVDYKKLSDEFFDLGSGEGIKKSNRDSLYMLSKMYKDVANDVFPLGPNISDDELEIPKINVKKSALDLMKRNEDVLKKNLQEKAKNKKLMSELSKKAKLDKLDSDAIEDEDESESKENMNSEVKVNGEAVESDEHRV